MGDVTLLLERARGGSVEARNELFASVYAELHRLARRKLEREAQFTELDTASLVHEVYLRLVRSPEVPGDNRRMFFAYAAGVMRSVIIDYVRRRAARKRGGAAVHVTLTSSEPEMQGPEVDVEALESALSQLAGIDERAHRIVELRYFGGLSVEEIAEVLDVSVTTVKRDWQKARALLFRLLQGDAA